METNTIERDKGFTLIELLIVIVILGILATVTVFAVQGIQSRGNDSACAADRKTLETAAEAYYAQVGSYPSSITDMVTGGFLNSYPSGTAAKHSYNLPSAANSRPSITGINACVTP